MKSLVSFVFLLWTLVTLQGCAVADTATDTGAIEFSPLPAFVPRHDRPRPVVAIIAENRYTELTDYVVPYGVLAEADVADVVAVATQSGPVQTFPSTFRIQPQATVTEFDMRYPDGADFVVVPAVHYARDEVLLNWIRAQAERGARIVGVCDGVWVVANAGLLEGREAVGHWYSFNDLKAAFPSTRWLTNRRYVGDDQVITTTGVTASVPVSLALVEAIAGQEKARAVAVRLGVEEWGPQHDSSQFSLQLRDYYRAAVNWLMFWKHERIGVPLAQGVDEIALALATDAYARTYRTDVVTIGDSDGIRSRRGLVILPDRAQAGAGEFDRQIRFDGVITPVVELENALANIEQQYGRDTAEFVALQLEYPLRAAD